MKKMMPTILFALLAPSANAVTDLQLEQMGYLLRDPAVRSLVASHVYQKESKDEGSVTQQYFVGVGPSASQPKCIGTLTYVEFRYLRQIDGPLQPGEPDSQLRADCQLTLGIGSCGSTARRDAFTILWPREKVELRCEAGR